MTHQELSGVISLLQRIKDAGVFGKVWPFPTHLDVTIVDESEVRAERIASDLSYHLDGRFTLDGMSRLQTHSMDRIRSKVRALVVITDRIAIPTESIKGFKDSLTFAEIGLKRDDPTFSSNSLIVDLDGKPFYRN